MEVCVVLAFKCNRKTLLNFKNASVSHCFRNSSLTIIWNNLGLSNYNRMKRKLGLKKKKTTKTTCYNFKKELSSTLFIRESRLALIHLWHLSTIPSFWAAYFAERLLKVFQMIVSDEFLKQRDTKAFLKFDGCFSAEFER